MKINVLALTRTPGECIRVNSDQDNTGIALSAYLEQLLESVAFEGVLSHSDKGTFHLSGRINALRAGECDRCLKPARRTVDVEINETFRRISDPEYDSESESYYGYAGHEIDIDQAIRDNLLLNLPLQLLCRDDCPGFCPVCGGDLNEIKCNCADQAHEISSPFSQLGKLLQDK
jgi:uncharacterized protein